MKKREYLNDYKLTASGEYVYTGKYYTYADIESGGKRRRNLIFLSAVILFAVVASGCINSSGMNNTFYVILPYIAEVAATFALCYNVVRLAYQKNDIKAYVYKPVVKNIPDSLKSLMLFSAISFVATIVYYIIHSIKGNLDYSVAYPIIKALIFGLAFLTLKVFKSICFEEK